MLADGAVRTVDDVNAATTVDVAPASGLVLIAIKNHCRGRLETPPGMIPAFPREGVRRVVENDHVVVWGVTWTKGLKTPPHFTSEWSRRSRAAGASRGAAHLER